ncbi:MAG: hypothetical protein JF606_23945 [Burkholderiales bacterium]|nr:hypothetical protein [Burkholderiales bacterium]
MQGAPSFMVLGFAMLMPLGSVHCVSNVGLAATVVGASLALRQLTQQGLAVIGGVLADRFGARPMICLRVLLRTAGFASLAFAGDALGSSSLSPSLPLVARCSRHLTKPQSLR